MGSSFSRMQNSYELKLVQDEDSQILKNADEIMDAIKAARRKIKERIEELELIPQHTIEVDREIAVLIRQDQYLEILQSKQKTELEEIFFSGKKKDDNCIYPDVLQWYQPPND